MFLRRSFNRSGKAFSLLFFKNDRSVRKREATRALLREEGFSETDLDRLVTPIGLSIGAESPEEIAVSILAQLIERRAQMRKHR